MSEENLKELSKEIKNKVNSMCVSDPHASVDHVLVKLINNFDEVPKAIQILEVVDKAIHGSLASGFYVSLFQIMLEMALKNEGIVLADIVPKACWRNR